MPDKISDSPIKQLCDIAITEEFNGLRPEIQSRIIEEISSNSASREDGGIMGKIFGNKKENAAIHIALVICVLLVIIGVICNATGKDYWNVIIPALTTGMGYIFGKGDK